jgi:hypothetical protein
MKKNKICYVVSFWLGKRRVEVQEYQNNRFFFLETQISALENIQNDIDTIIFNFNITTEYYQYLTEIFRIIPKKIKNSKVEVTFRENIGMSYGAFSDIFKSNLSRYDYYIFNEDDYVFINPNWDTYLVNKFESIKNCGYLSMIVSSEDSGYPKHASHSSGISSYKILKQVLDKFGELPHSKNNTYSNNEWEGQIRQTNEIVKLGYDIFDVRDDYKVLFLNHNKQIIEYHQNNHKILIQPSHLN